MFLLLLLFLHPPGRDESICNLALALEAVYTRQFWADFASSGPKTKRICGSPRAEPTTCLLNYIAACLDPPELCPLVTLENVERNKRVMPKSDGGCETP